MKIIEAGYKIIRPKTWEGAKEDIYSVIEEAGRTCYKSEAAMTPESGAKFIKKLIENRHEAMLEHAHMTVKFIVDRGVSHEMVRHRMASFAQESTRYCVAGDTKLMFSNPSLSNNVTIKELYDNMITSKNGAWQRMRIRYYNMDRKNFDYSTIKHVFYNGEKECIKISTALGYSIICTPDHLLYTENGYKPAGDFEIDDKIYVNGTELLYKNQEWLHLQNITLNKTFVQIAKEYGFNVSTLKKWARKFNLPKKGTGYFNIGHTPWNKGITDERQANTLRKYHHCGRRKDKILKEDTNNYWKHKGDFCDVCRDHNQLEVHHIDKDHTNNKPSNLITLCKRCHARVHSQNLLTAYLDKIVNIENVGIQSVYDLEMNDDHHNYISNGFISHNCNYSKNKFGNELTFIEPLFFKPIPKERREEIAKYGNGVCDDEKSSALEKQYGYWCCSCRISEISYLRMLDNNATPQEARDVLPTSLKTEIVVTANMREWRHIFKLRAAGETGKPHPQIAEVMIPLLKECQEHLPELFGDIQIKEDI